MKNALISLLLLAACTAGWGQSNDSPVAQPASQASQPTQAGGEEDFSPLLLDRPSVPISEPSSGGKPKKVVPVLPPSNSTMVDRLCRLVRHANTGWYMLEFLDEPGRAAEPPRLLLFSHYLEQIEPLADADPAPLLRVTGETFIYKHLAFFLLTTPATVLSPEEVATAPAVDPSAQKAPDPAPPAGKGPAAGQPGGAADDEMPSAEDIRSLLRSENVGRALPVPPTPVAADVKPVPSVAPGGGRAAMAYGVEGMVVDRLIRLAPEKDNSWVLARFESDNTLQQPPLRLLPCRLLELAERVAASKTLRMPRFRVSGLITIYKGKRYLLLRKLVRERDLGQF